jgi:hypothetical protein
MIFFSFPNEEEEGKKMNVKWVRIIISIVFIKEDRK